VTGSRTRAQRRAAERRMHAAGVELVARSHLPLVYNVQTDDAQRLAILSVHIDDALVKLTAQGADLDGMLAITIGQHPSFPGTVTVEAKAAQRKADGSTPE
jgi:hypothetical protein